MNLRANYKVIARLEAEELSNIVASASTLSERFIWERIQEPLERFYSIPLASYLSCILTFDGDSNKLCSEVESIRRVNPSFPLICLTPPELLAKAVPHLLGAWDTVIPQVEGWEKWLEKELLKLAGIEAQKMEFSKQGCILSNEKSLRAYNFQILEHFLNKYDGSVYEVARRLDIGKSTIYRMLKEQKEVHSN